MYGLNELPRLVQEYGCWMSRTVRASSCFQVDLGPGHSLPQTAYRAVCSLLYFSTTSASYLTRAIAEAELVNGYRACLSGYLECCLHDFHILPLTDCLSRLIGLSLPTNACCGLKNKGTRETGCQKCPSPAPVILNRSRLPMNTPLFVRDRIRHGM